MVNVENDENNWQSFKDYGQKDAAHKSQIFEVENNWAKRCDSIGVKYL